jgi:hypothetical protein
LEILNITSSQKARLLQLYWEMREAILNMNGISRGDFEFGELFSKIGTILNEIRAPTMMISNDKLTEIQESLLRMRALIKNWIGFEAVIGSVDSFSSIIEEMLSTRHPVMQVPNDTKQRLTELYSGMQVEIRKAYDHT